MATLTIPIVFTDEQIAQITKDVLARLCADCPYRENGEECLLKLEGKDLNENRN